MSTSKDTVQVTAVIRRDIAGRLDAYAERHRWSRSAAVAALIERGIAADAQEQDS